jgi:hypothetical protein
MLAHLQESDAALGNTGANSSAEFFRQTRNQWAQMENKARNSAVQKLTKQSNDAVTDSLLSHKTLAGPRQNAGTIKTTQTPDEIIASLKAVSDPQAFEEFKSGTRAKLIDNSLGKDGTIDHTKLAANIRKMGGNFPSLFDGKEQQELLVATQGMKRLTDEAAAASAASEGYKAAAKDVPEGVASQIPRMPIEGKKALKIGLGAALGGGAFSYVAADPGMVSMATKGVALMGIASVLSNSPNIVKALLESPEARQQLAKLAGKGAVRSSPAIDAIYRMIIQGVPTAGAHYMENEGTPMNDVPEPPKKMNLQISNPPNQGPNPSSGVRLK